MRAPASEPPTFSGMTKAQLLDYAEENGVEGVNSSMKKAEILAVLEGVE